MNPIWKDYFVDLGNADSVAYEIRHNYRLIYSGKAWRRPGENTIRVKINDICADYISNTLPALALQFTPMARTVFEILVETDGVFTVKESVEFINDWSYDESFDPCDGLSIPVNGRVDPRQWLIYTVFAAQMLRVDVELTDGTKFTTSISTGIQADFNVDFNSDFARHVAAQNGTALFRLLNSNVKRLTIDGKVYEVTAGCDRYVLYYTNAAGGWDSLLIEGNHAENDSVTRYTFEKEYDNRTVQNRGRVNYANEIVKSLKLYTAPMSDDQSAKMHNLLNSANVYLYDLERDQMIPVILKNTSTEYKTFKGGGRKLVTYAIDVEFANTRIRR